jgi:hypothetical protein
MAMTLIYSTKITSTTQYLNFTSIPQTYSALLVIASLHSNRSSGNDGGLNFRFNDATTNYDWQQYYANANSGAPTAYGGTNYSETYITAPGMPQDTKDAQAYSATQLYIPNYASSSKYKSCVGYTTNMPSTTGTGASGPFTGYWRDTTPINKITIATNGFGSSSFTANSSYYLYGIN